MHSKHRNVLFAFRLQDWRDTLPPEPDASTGTAPFPVLS
jgi:hypothetical protein